DATQGRDDEACFLHLFEPHNVFSFVIHVGWFFESKQESTSIEHGLAYVWNRATLDFGCHCCCCHCCMGYASMTKSRLFIMAQPFFMEVPCSLLTNSDVLCCLFDIYNKANTIHLSTAFYVRDYIGSFFFFSLS